MTNLFIWDDYNWMLIEGSDDYDQTSFFIVRKLFVQWPKEGDAAVWNDLIRQYFEPYGSVESVHTVNEESIGANADIHEAYVTFVRSEDAYNAFAANRRGSKAIKVLPADTWRQPGVQLSRPEAIKFLHDTAHRCNDPKEEAVQCDLAKASSKDPECFCEFGTATFHVEINQRSWMKLKTIREICRPLKPRLQTLVLHYDMEPDDKHKNSISNDEYFRRVIQVLSVCVGDVYYEMTIFADRAISIEMLNDLAPLLQPLETFTFQSKSNASVMFALPAYCPNVDFLLVEANSWDGEFSNEIPQHWLSLSHLILKGNLNIESNTEHGAKLRRFIEVNKQLTSLQIELIMNYRLYETIANNLENLEILSFICPTYNDVNPILDLLPGMDNLSKITITILTVKNELGPMVNCAQRLKRVEHLKTVTLLQNFNPTSSHHEELKEHLACTVKHHENCECHPSERVIEFGSAEVEVKLPQDKQVLVAIVNVKDADTSIGKTLQATAIIDAFKRTMQFYPNKIQTIKMDTDDHCKFINVCST